MSVPRPNHERSLGFLFADISRLARKEFDRRVRDLGLTRAQWLFLYYLGRQPGCTQSELAEILQMEKITISRQANRLEKAGWIRRTDHADDARAYHLALTPQAERIIARLDDRASRLRSDYLHGIPPPRRTALLADLSPDQGQSPAFGRPPPLKFFMNPRLSTLLRVFSAVAMLAVAAACNRSTAVAVAPAIPVQVAVAMQQDVPRRIESIGAVQALRTVAIKSQVDGIIAQVHFREGDNVQEGSLLVTLDRRPFENSLRIARADLVNAQAEATRAQADAERYTQLDQQDAISKEQYAELTTKAETTRALAQAKEAAVANAELQLGYTQIRAPITGRTGQRLLHEGALVKANDNSFTLVTINQLTPITVAYAVPEQSLDEIRTAFTAGTATVAVTDRTTGITRENGRLEFIDNTVDATTGMITLKAVFPNDDEALWPGRFVYVITQVGLDRVGHCRALDGRAEQSERLDGLRPESRSDRRTAHRESRTHGGGQHPALRRGQGRRDRGHRRPAPPAAPA